VEGGEDLDLILNIKNLRGGGLNALVRAGWVIQQHGVLRLVCIISKGGGGEREIRTKSFET